MADRNTYLRYKRDEKLLVYWITHASNSIIHKSHSGTTPPPNTIGEISLPTLLSLSKLIAKHIKPIPNTIYRLFHSIIKARTETYAVFQQISASNPDPELERSNEKHKFWIDGLTDAFRALGGDPWTPTRKRKSGKEAGRENETSKSNEADEEDEHEVIFSNKFAPLNLNNEMEEEIMGSATEAEGSANSVAITQSVTSKKPAKKGKKKRPKKTGNGKGKKPENKKCSLAEVPLESYRLCDDETGGIWHQVAYDGLNSAVAGTISNIALGIVTNTETMVFAEFPAHIAFETITKTIIRGDVTKTQGMFRFADLLDFITDFQKTRSGKPTKSMLSEIKDWDPEFNLAKATKNQRLKWPQAYTINWLYEFVNHFSSDTVLNLRTKEDDKAFEIVDWVLGGPLNLSRRLFGLNGFAAFITRLAMQKPGTDVRSKVLPSYVLQLQCIVDFLTISRSWTPDYFKGHILKAAPASSCP
ncbi:hypothetical protein AJ79_01898 [Helicocarpus griseus UAMH5409]|uniref:DUF6604 domain-containing protein n=1 Tax=Helicocarpus griseus UAMH5409 TaxID=1447875 RepID=A0A2B7Y561_9EURO|nr:hypothetical protein AJ79_01898 [Helicocarpus griseus UAMH5409]